MIIIMPEASTKEKSDSPIPSASESIPFFSFFFDSFYPDFFEESHEKPAGGERGPAGDDAGGSGCRNH